MGARISVIVPVYNAALYVTSCIDSLLASTYDNFEVIVVDDGSTDSTPVKLARYETFENVRIIRQENKGVSVARNTGLSYAKGEYVAFVDSDDLVHSDFLMACAKIIENNCDFVLVKFCEFEGDLKPKEEKIDLNKYELLLNPVVDYQKEGFKGSCWSFVVRRDLIGKLEFPVGISRGEDLFFSYALLLRLKRGILLHDPVYYYRRTEGSLDGCALSVCDVRGLAEVLRRLHELYSIKNEGHLKFLQKNLFPRKIKDIFKQGVRHAVTTDAVKMKREIVTLLNSKVVSMRYFSFRWKCRLWIMSLEMKKRWGYE